MFIIIVVLFFKIEKMSKKINQENFALGPDDLSVVRNEINRIYDMDVEAIRNLGHISKSLLTGTNTFTASANGTPGSLTIPANITTFQGDVRINGNLYVGNVRVENNSLYVGACKIWPNGDITVGNYGIDGAYSLIDTTRILTPTIASKGLNIGACKIWPNGDITVGNYAIDGTYSLIDTNRVLTPTVTSNTITSNTITSKSLSIGACKIEPSGEINIGNLKIWSNGDITIGNYGIEGQYSSIDKTRMKTPILYTNSSRY